MAKDPKHLESQKVMVYLEIITKMSSDIYQLGEIIYMNHQWGGINSKDKDILLKKLNDQMVIIEDKRVPLAKEISKRIKADTGINKGPWDISIMIKEIYDNHPVLYKGEDEIKFEASKKATIDKVPFAPMDIVGKIPKTKS